MFSQNVFKLNTKVQYFFKKERKLMHPCHHGQSFTHKHHHIGVAEGVRPLYLKKLQIAMALAVVYLLAQGCGAYLSGSLALWADAGHKLADVLAMGLALGASWLASLATSKRKTFGFHRLEILAALINGMALLCIALYILYEAAERLLKGEVIEIKGQVMFSVATIGLLLNVVSAVLLYPSREMNLNVKGALFHLMTDIADSVSTLIASLSVMFLHWLWVDSLLSLIIATMVGFNAIRLFKEAFHILLEAAPSQQLLESIEHFIRHSPGVLDVHDLHLWTITTGKTALLVHVKVNNEHFHSETVEQLEHSLREHFDLCHLTLQLEPPNFQEAAIPF
jgi:cobalt-zinc-cadmium efflux system protein